MPPKAAPFMIAIVIIGLSYSSSRGCTFPLVNPPPYTFYMSWQPGPHVVQLSIDDAFAFNPTVTEQLRHGVFNWNLWSLADCSLIQFAGGASTHFGPEVYANSYRVPPWNVYILNSHCSVCPWGSGTLMTYDNDRVVGAKIELDPSNINSTFLAHNISIAFFSYAASHEIGHTFGLAHDSNTLVLSPGSSVMAGWIDDYDHNRSMPTVCDAAVVAGLYCFFCIPTPCGEDEAWSDVTCSCQPMGGVNCTTPGWDGSCPPGTAPDGFGWCCAYDEGDECVTREWCEARYGFYYSNCYCDIETPVLID